MQTANAQCIDGHQAFGIHVRLGSNIAFAPTRGRGFIAEIAIVALREPCDTVLAQQTVVTETLRLVQTKRDHGRGISRSERHGPRVITIEHTHRALTKDAALRCSVSVEAAMPVQM